MITVGAAGKESREIVRLRSVRSSIANCWPILRMNSSSGVAKRCIGNTTEARKRRVISETPSSDIVYAPSIGTIRISSRPIAAKWLSSSL